MQTFFSNHPKKCMKQIRKNKKVAKMNLLNDIRRRILLPREPSQCTQRPTNGACIKPCVYVKAHTTRQGVTRREFCRSSPKQRSVFIPIDDANLDSEQRRRMSLPGHLVETVRREPSRSNPNRQLWRRYYGAGSPAQVELPPTMFS